MFCPMCGAPNQDEDQFCGNCGAALQPEDVLAQVPARAESEPSANAAEGILADTAYPGETTEAEWVEPTPGPDSTTSVSAGQPPLPPSAPPPPYRPTPARAMPTAATSGLAIAALVLGIGGLTILPLVGSVLAILFGYMARRDIRQRPGERTGDGMALAGIVMGWIAVGLAILGVLLGIGFGVCGLCGALGSGNFQ